MVWLWSLAHACSHGSLAGRIAVCLCVCVGNSKWICFSLRLASGWFNILLVLNGICIYLIILLTLICASTCSITTTPVHDTPLFVIETFSCSSNLSLVPRPFNALTTYAARPFLLQTAWVRGCSSLGTKRWPLFIAASHCLSTLFFGTHFNRTFAIIVYFSILCFACIGNAELNVDLELLSKL